MAAQNTKCEARDDISNRPASCTFVSAQELSFSFFRRRPSISVSVLFLLLVQDETIELRKIFFVAKATEHHIVSSYLEHLHVAHILFARICDPEERRQHRGVRPFRLIRIFWLEGPVDVKPYPITKHTECRLFFFFAKSSASSLLWEPGRARVWRLEF